MWSSDQVATLSYLLLTVATGAPGVTLAPQQLHFERLLGGDDGFRRKGGELHLWTQDVMALTKAAP